jgi:radical SAM-linked protein
MSDTADRLRLRFSKTGRAVYISHLDLLRTMQRAFLRAELPIRYSEGFNPHAQLFFALPLSVGTASLCELMDFRLRAFMSLPEIPFRLNRVLPEGVKILEAYEWENKFGQIKWLDVDGVFEYDASPTAETLQGLMDFFARERIIISKKTKRGTGEADIAPDIRNISFDTEGDRVRLKALVSAQEPTLKPELLSAALGQLAPELRPDFAAFTRTQLYDAALHVFR